MSAASAAHAADPSRLLGRDHELALLDTLSSGSPKGGASLLIRGPAGIGKTALVEMAISRARSKGLRVFVASANESEAHLPFAGLRQLLRPALAEVAGLPRPQSQAIRTVFGMIDSPPPNAFLIAVATWNLLSANAQTSKLLVIENAQWLDGPSSHVVAFVGRRLGRELIFMLATARDDLGGRLAPMRLKQLSLSGIDDNAAHRLLDASAHDVAPGVRERLIRESGGNPLALIELPKALTDRQLSGHEPLPGVLPLTRRLEDALRHRGR